MYSHHYLAHNVAGSASWIGSFSGAFFAFIFGLISYLVFKKREGFLEHRKALCKVERMLVKHLYDLGGLLQITNGAIDSVSANPPRTPVSQLFPILIPDDADIALQSIDLINDLSVYRMSVGKLNFNANTINHTLTLIEDLYINGQPPIQQNFQLAKQFLGKLKQDLPILDKQAQKLLIKIQIHLSRIKGKDGLIYGFYSFGVQHISEDELKNGQEKLNQTITDLSQRASVGY